MALGATIYRTELDVSDLGRGYHDHHSLRIARHPSETEERLMIRLLAFGLHAAPTLRFGRGLSDESEPDLLRANDTGAIDEWIEVGLPDERRLRQAHGRAGRVVVWAYGGSRARAWWGRHGTALQRLERLQVFEVSQVDSTALAAMARRDLSISMTIDRPQVLVASDAAAVPVEILALKS